MPLKNDGPMECPKTEQTGQEARSPSAFESVALTSEYQKFSELVSYNVSLQQRWLPESFLTSPVFSVVIGYETSKTFLLHAALLDRESDELAKSVNSGLREGETKRIVLKQEDLGLFDYFVDYLYSDRWLENGEASREQTTSSLLDFIPSVKDFRQTTSSVLLCVSSRHP